MTATDELRRMLDEAGEYYKTSGNRTWWGRPIDMQTGKPINVFHYQAQPMGEDRLFVELQLATPEQAIAATLGPWTCQQEEGGWSTEGDHARVWLTCGHDCMVETVADLPNFCPECGAKVVGE